jgi:hypothetical protein
MVDKITTVPKPKIAKRIGRLDEEDVVRLNRAVTVFWGWRVRAETQGSRGSFFTVSINGRMPGAFVMSAAALGISRPSPPRASCPVHLTWDRHVRVQVQAGSDPLRLGTLQSRRTFPERARQKP